MSIITPLVDLPVAIEFVERKLAAFNLDKIERFQAAGALRSKAVNWTYHLPERVAKGSREFKSQYRLYASVNQNPDHGPAEELVRGLWDERENPLDPHWDVFIRLADRTEHLIFGLGAASFQYLRRTKQVAGVARHSDARRFACGWVSEFAPQLDRYYLFDQAEVVVEPHYVNCFGVLLPRGLLDRPVVKDEELYFEQPVARLLPVDDGGIGASMAQAAERTWADIDRGLLTEIQRACSSEDDHDRTSAWLVLGDWLEERGDRRAAWLRSQTLRLPDAAALLRQEPAD